MTAIGWLLAVDDPGLAGVITAGQVLLAVSPASPDRSISAIHFRTQGTVPVDSRGATASGYVNDE
jgi:hypothetical protein